MRVPACTSSLFARRLASQLEQFSLLLGRQFVLNSHEQRHLFSVLLEVRAFCAFIDTDTATTRFVRIL
jgi:hypothetical protein